MTGSVRPRRGDPGSALRALAVAILAVAVVATSYVIFVRTAGAQRLDQVAGSHLGQSTPTPGTLTTLLHGVTVGLIALGLGLSVVIAVARRRRALAAGALAIVAGANLTTQGLKNVVLTRPDYGYGSRNSFPSGHITVIASLVLAALLVMPRGARWLVQLGGSLGVAVTGVGLVVAGWHRPSDVVAGLGVTLAWGAFVLAVISTAGVDESPGRPRSHPIALLVGLVVAAAFFIAVGVRPDETLADLVVLAVTMPALAVAGALAIGIFARLVDARVA
ncbi:MAG: phosphatase PAP2 family protein [Propionibacteriales bacterium]|nr:phosphatase PAP2 family protein [Propionibacteriales bacterium]